jgi:hypothetical protein
MIEDVLGDVAAEEVLDLPLFPSLDEVLPRESSTMTIFLVRQFR